MSSSVVRQLKVYVVRLSGTEEPWQTELLSKVEKAVGFTPLDQSIISSQSTIPERFDRDKTLFIMTPFRGDVFDKLFAQKARIVSPLLTLNALRTFEGVIPNLQYPLHSSALKGTLFSSTGLDRWDRIHIFERVQMMGGKCSKEFTSHVTHLICEDAESKKYAMAFRLKIPVIQQEWVNHTWRLSAQENVKGDDPRLIPYLYPIFKNCKISSTGFGSVQRSFLKKMVEGRGGVYSGRFCHTCTHLVCHEFDGSKYDLAVHHGKPAVGWAWFYDCLNSGYLMPTDFYVSESTDPGKKHVKETAEAFSSTPVDSRQISEFSSEISVVVADVAAADQMQTVERRISDVPNFFSSESFDQESTRGSVETNFSALSGSMPMRSFDHMFPAHLKKDILAAMDSFRHDPDKSLFHGLTVVLDNIPVDLVDCMRDTLRLGDASVEDGVSSLVTHVITGRAELEMVEQLCYLKVGTSCQVVSPQWFVNCLRLRTVPTDLEEVDEEKKLSKQRVDTLRGSWQEEHAFEPVFTCPDSCSLFRAIFDGKRVLLVGLHESSKSGISNLVKCSGGTVSADCLSENSWDVVISSLVIPRSALVAPSSRYITEIWLRSCIDSSVLLPEDNSFLFQPIVLSHWMASPLKACVITPSGFQGTEKSVVAYLCKHGGARIEDNLVKTTRNQCGTTHLITNETLSKKFRAAKTWKIPIVGLNWLIQSLIEGRRADENSVNVCEPVDEFNLSRIRADRDAVCSLHGRQLLCGQNESTRIAESLEAPAFTSSSSNAITITPDRPFAEISDVSMNTTKSPCNPALMRPDFADVSMDTTTSPCNPALMRPDFADVSMDTTTSPINRALIRSNFADDSIDNTKSPSHPTLVLSNVANVSMNSTESPSNPVLIQPDKCLSPNVCGVSVDVPKSPINLASIGRSKDHSTNKLAGENQRPQVHKSPHNIFQDKSNELKHVDCAWSDNECEQISDRQIYKSPALDGTNNTTFEPSANEENSFRFKSDAEMSSTKVDGSFVIGQVDTTRLDLTGDKKSFGLQSQFTAGHVSTAVGGDGAGGKRAKALGKICVILGEQLRMMQDEQLSISVDSGVMPTPTATQATYNIDRVPFLTGARIAASKRLAKDHVEYNKLVSVTGGTFFLSYSSSCTHFLFKGRLNETSKEYRTARDDGVKIVSPHWLYACYKERKWLDEDSFPHCYDPCRKLCMEPLNTSVAVDTVKLENAMSILQTVRQDMANPKDWSLGTAVEPHTPTLQMKAPSPQLPPMESAIVSWADEEAVMELSRLSSEPQRSLKFCISGLRASSGRREQLLEIAQQKLNGETGVVVSDSSYTHLITETITRNERLLTALASSGTWVLKPSFLEDSKQNERYMDEEPYEWKPEDVSGELERSLCRAVQRCRGENGPLFSDWGKVTLVRPSPDATLPNNRPFDRLVSTLQAGGVEKVEFVPASWSGHIDAGTMVFANEKALSEEEKQKWLEACSLSKADFLNCEYIAAYLYDEKQSRLKDKYRIRATDKADVDWHRKRKQRNPNSTDSKHAKRK